VSDRPVEPLDFARGAALIGDEEAAAVERVVRSRSLFRYYGPDLQGTVAAFERDVCAALEVPFAVAVSSGTAALRCALAALGIGPGARVAVPAFTFIATVNAVVAAGATPVFVDVDDSLDIDPGAVPASGLDAVIAVHIENVVADVDALPDEIPVIEDAAQAIGASRHGRAAGSLGAIGCFSLQLEKNITAGEGGIVTTADEGLYLRASRYQDQGGQFVTSYASSRGDEMSEPFAAENLRMGELAGAVAGVQLGRLPFVLESMRANKRRILDAVGAIDGLTPRRVDDPAGDGGSSCMWLLPDQARAKAFVKGLLRRGLPGAQMYRGEPVYWNPAVLARRTALGETGSWEAERGMLPNSEALIARNVIVPVGVRYTAADCDRLAEGIRAAAEEALA
jgi:8-amino-3,8-dideoxy-alpha-D-manno-octulosonate transaminase